MSYGIMGSTRSSWMLTYTTTRPVRVLYFDGESATLMGAGRMDTQMLALFGNITGPDSNPGGFRGLWEEYLRANGLCNWLLEKGLRGQGWGFEGVVRMNAGFEVIWCDFNSPSLKLVSWLNVSAPLLGSADDDLLAQINDPNQILLQDEELADWKEEVRDLGLSRQSPTSYYPLPPSPTRSDRATDPSDPAKPPNWRRNDQEPFLRSQGWGWFRSATKQYAGEQRVKLHSCGILSYYSPVFQIQALARAAHEREALNLTEDGLWNGSGTSGDRNVALTELLRRRRSHRLDSMPFSDAVIMQDSTAAVLRDIVVGNISCSGMDWMGITSEIIRAYSSPLMAMRLHLEASENLKQKNRTMVRAWLSGLRDRTHSLLLPFLEYPTGAAISDFWSTSSPLYFDTLARCHFHHTRLLENITLNAQESLLQWSVEETMFEICRTIVSVGFAVEEMWGNEFNENMLVAPEPWEKRQREKVSAWAHGVEELMSWLGWAGEWTRCDKVCEWDEECYIPMWPMIHSDRFRRRPPPEDFRPPPGYGDDRRRPGGPGKRPPGGGRPGFPSETDLWQPKCVKADYIMA